ncbi:MAG: hypothetical protein JSV04_02995, partial [Candidatus Heimdallarchaeota archaeon]
YIEYFWSATDLADPKNYGSDGSRETPYLIGIYNSTAGTTIITTTLFNTTTIYTTVLNSTTIYTTVYNTTTMYTTIYNSTTVYVTTSVSTTPHLTSTTTESAGTIGFELWLIIGTVGIVVMIYRKGRHV